jgi:putative addiction module component (TIGR02574 family)
MPTPLQALEAEAMKLSPEERAELADRLWLSAQSAEDVEAAWSAEIQRRISEVDSGAAVCRPWHEVMAELKTLAER